MCCCAGQTVSRSWFSTLARSSTFSTSQETYLSRPRYVGAPHLFILSLTLMFSMDAQPHLALCHEDNERTRVGTAAENKPSLHALLGGRFKDEKVTWLRSCVTAWRTLNTSCGNSGSPMEDIFQCTTMDSNSQRPSVVLMLTTVFNRSLAVSN